MMSSVLIKDVDKQLYARFKAEAALRGIKIGEALQLAMKKWLEEETPITEGEKERIKNNALYRQLLPSLLEDHENDWVIITSGQLHGIYPDRNAAVNEIQKEGLQNSYNLVTPISQRKRYVRLGFGRIVS